MSVREQSPKVGPLLLQPRLDEKIWGGRGLARFGFELPPGVPIGEALITAAEAIVAVGPFAGHELGEIVAADPRAAMGANGLRVTGGRPIFPLLVKLIDAAADLSIQVHPNDQQAPPGSLGKTEAWHVLAAEPGAALYIGLKPEATFARLAEMARAGQSTASLIRRLEVQPGLTVLLPAGTVHALGAGVLVYEIQQPSAITYRFDDWGRVDASGHPRELHVEQALAVLDPVSRPEPLLPLPIASPTGRRTLLVTSAYFAAERIVLDPGDTLATVAPESPQVFTCLAGQGAVSTPAGSQDFAGGQTVVTLAHDQPVQVAAQSHLELLRGWVPSVSLESR